MKQQSSPVKHIQGAAKKNDPTRKM